MASGDEAGTKASSERIAALEAALAERDAQNAELTAQVEALTKQVELLTEQLNRNSKNSHLPPSSDGPGKGSSGGHAARNKRKAERKRGGQKGHRGTHRELLPADRIDTVEDLFPALLHLEWVGGRDDRAVGPGLVGFPGLEGLPGGRAGMGT